MTVVKVVVLSTIVVSIYSSNNALVTGMAKIKLVGGSVKADEKIGLLCRRCSRVNNNPSNRDRAQLGRCIHKSSGDQRYIKKK